MNKLRKGFTLIEVMVSVVIISVVIMALLQMQGNNTHIFSTFLKQAKINQYNSLFISNSEYGFEEKSLEMDTLVSDFKLEDELRQELKQIKVEVVYQELESIDMREFTGDEEASSESENKEVQSNLIFEVGKTIFKVKDTSSNLLRLRIQ